MPKPGAPFMTSLRHEWVFPQSANRPSPSLGWMWALSGTRSIAIRAGLSTPQPLQIHPNPLIPSQIKLLKTWHSYPLQTATI